MQFLKRPLEHTHTHTHTQFIKENKHKWVRRKNKTSWLWMRFITIIIIIILFFRAAPRAYGNFQARGQIRATASSPHHSHSNVGSKLRLAYTTAHGNAGSPTHWERLEIEPASSEILDGFISAVPQQEFLFFLLYLLVFKNNFFSFLVAYVVARPRIR